MLDAVTKGYLALHPESAARTLARIDRRPWDFGVSAIREKPLGRVDDDPSRA